MSDELPLRAPRPPNGLRAQSIPSVSVLIPAYNAADTVAAAVESALTQRPAPLEVIISDDGSTDDLDSALRPYLDHVQVVRGPNGGNSVARNRAAAVAQGELLALLDADDTWCPGHMDALTRVAAARPDLAVLATDAFVVHDGTPDRLTYYATRDFYTERQDLAILRIGFIFGPSAVRAEAFRSVGGYTAGSRFAEDWDLWMRLLLRGHRAGLIDVPLYEYWRRPGTLTGRRVDIALGVLDALARNEPLASSPDQRRQLRITTQRWKERAAREAARSRSSAAGALAIRAAVGRPTTTRVRAGMLARATLAAVRRDSRAARTSSSDRQSQI